MDPIDNNPYSVPDPIGLEPDVERPRGSASFWQRLPLWARSLICWSSICVISAAPSFIFGYELSKGQATAMVLGIATFIVIYVAVDLQTIGGTFRNRPYVSVTLKTTYGLRILQTVLFPLGVMVDLISGMIATAIYETIAGQNLVNSNSPDEPGFLGTYILTMI